MQTSTLNRRTPLFQYHLKHRAQIVDFAGWDMPVKYTEIMDEHINVRQHCGIFDISHMGIFKISGKDAVLFSDYMMTVDLQKLIPMTAIYGLICNKNGQILDDVIAYKVNSSLVWIIANASNSDKVHQWFLDHCHKYDDIHLEYMNQKFGLVAIQGPKSTALLQKMGLNVPDKFLKFIPLDSTGDWAKGWISRSGYTGEIGYELCLPVESMGDFWEHIFRLGKEENLLPIGLGARDSLRLEMKYMLYGHEISEKTSPFDAGLSWAIHLNKNDFSGKDALLSLSKVPSEYKLVAFKLEEAGVPRADYVIYDRDHEIGYVTSGGYSPSLGQGIGMGYIKINNAAYNSEILIKVRKRFLKARIIKDFLKANVKSTS